MKTQINPFMRRIAVLSAASVTIGTTCAANRYWDINGTTSGLGSGVGNWDTSATIWNTATAGTSATVAFANDDAAFFQTAGVNTVTLDTAVTANSVTQTTNSTATTISGAGTLTITTGNITNSGNTAFNLNPSGLALGATGSISATSAINIGAGISGSGVGFNKTGGTATLTLSGDNTFSGPMTVNNGLVASSRISSGTPFGTGSITLNGSGSALNFGSGAVGLSIIPNAAGTTSLTGGTQSGSLLSFANTAYINLTRFDASSPLTYTYGSGSGSVLNRVDRGVLVFMDNTGAIPANMGVSGGNNFVVNGTTPTITNGMVAAYFIGARNGGGGDGTFLTYDATHGFKPVTYDVTNSLSGWDDTKKVTISSGTVATDAAAYALRATGAISINSGVTVSIGNGGSTPAGLIAYNNISGGTLAFGASEVLISTGGSNSTISSSISGSGGLTKTQYAGTNGQLTLTGSNSYSGITTVNTGVLNIGSNGTTGDLGNSNQVVLGPGAILNFNRSNGASYSGTITGSGNVSALNATSLSLATPLATDVSSATLRAAEAASISITKGIWNTLNLGINGTGAQMRGILAISNATVNVTSSGRYAVGNYNIQSGGSLVVSASDRFTYAVTNEQTGTINHSMNLSAGGTLDIYSSASGTAFGNGTASNSVTINQSGGLAKFGVNDSTSTTNRNLTIGGINANAKTAYDLAGGTMMVRGTLQSGGAAGAGGINNFNFRGGVLVAANITTVNLGSTDSTTDPVANSLSIGTLVNRGGMLAPGDIGIVGKTGISGNYTVNSGKVTIDIGGTTASSLFQESANSGKFDNLFISGSLSLGGDLGLNLVDGYLPGFTDVFKIIDSGTLTSGSFFTNVVDGGILATLGNEGTFKVYSSDNDVFLSEFTVIPEPRAALLGGLGLLVLFRRRRCA